MHMAKSKNSKQVPISEETADAENNSINPKQIKEEKKRLKLEKKEINRQKRIKQKEQAALKKEKLKQRKDAEKQKRKEEKIKQKALNADPTYRAQQKEQKLQEKIAAKKAKAAQKEKALAKKAVQKEKAVAQKIQNKRIKEEAKQLRKDPQWQLEQKKKKEQAKQQSKEKKNRQKEKAAQKKEAAKQKKAELKRLKKDPEWIAGQKAQKQIKKDAAKQKKLQKKEKAKAEKLLKKEAKANLPPWHERFRPQSKKQWIILILGLFIFGLAGGAGGYLWQHPDPDTVVERHFKHLQAQKADGIAEFFPAPRSFLRGKVMSNEKYAEVKKIICEKIVDLDYTITDVQVSEEHATVTVEVLNYDLGGTIEATLQQYRIDTMLEYVSGKYEKSELEGRLVTMLLTNLTEVTKETSQTIEVSLSKVGGKWQLDPLNGPNIPLAQCQTGYIYKGDKQSESDNEN